MQADKKVLVVSSGYSSDGNPYKCAFIHMRVKAYIEAGFTVQVCVVDSGVKSIEGGGDRYDGVSIERVSIAGLRELLYRQGPYDVIVGHFLTVEMMNVLEREASRTRIVVFFHGGDVMCERFRCGPGRQYFSGPVGEELFAAEYAPKKVAFRRLVDNPNLYWVFVSESLRREAEDYLGFSFGTNACVIPNWIREDRFKYREKTPDKRNHIFFCRRFDNERVYCVEEVMTAIRRLSSRAWFKELDFEVYGDGAEYDRLVAPVRGFPNVHLYRHFLRNEDLPAVFDGCGVALYPSRYDSQGVAISEAAASGLVVIGGDIPAIRSVYPQEEFGMLVDPDSPDGIVAAIERLHSDPDLFQRLSRTMGKRVVERFSRARTIDAECVLLSQLARVKPTIGLVSETPLLSVIVPAYNMERYLDVCVGSMLAQPLAGEMEILVVNDGSRDATLEIARRLELQAPGVVKVIDKTNGGHGSCINEALRVVRGRYVKVLDADDWLISGNLARMLVRLRSETADCVLTAADYDFVESGETSPILVYGNLIDGASHRFDEMQFDGYGFKSYGPIIHTVTWRTQIVLEAKIALSEKVSYDDMQWNVLPLRRAETIAYYDFPVYRYTMGRTGQSVALDTVKRKWKDHDLVFSSVADFALNDPELSPARKRYVLHNILGEFGCNDIYVLYLVHGLKGVREFIARWGGHEELWREIVRFSVKQGGETVKCLRSLKEGRAAIRMFCRPDAIAERPGETSGVSRIDQVKAVASKIGLGARCRRFIKGCLPYGLVRIWQKRVYGF